MKDLEKCRVKFNIKEMFGIKDPEDVVSIEYKLYRSITNRVPFYTATLTTGVLFTKPFYGSIVVIVPSSFNVDSTYYHRCDIVCKDGHTYTLISGFY